MHEEEVWDKAKAPAVSLKLAVPTPANAPAPQSPMAPPAKPDVDLGKVRATAVSGGLMDMTALLSARASTSTRSGSIVSGSSSSAAVGKRGKDRHKRKKRTAAQGGQVRGQDVHERKRRRASPGELDARAATKAKAKFAAGNTALFAFVEKMGQQAKHPKVADHDDDDDYDDDGDDDGDADDNDDSDDDDDGGDDNDDADSDDDDDDDDADDVSEAPTEAGAGKAAAADVPITASATSDEVAPVDEAATSPIIAAQNARDDKDAPSTLLLAARELRGRINGDTPDGFGLMMNNFHIRKRLEGEQKKLTPGQKKKARFNTDKYAGWVVSCDVCDTCIAVDSSCFTPPPLYAFSTQHLLQSGHRSAGKEIFAKLKLASQTTARDAAAEAAASNSRLAVTSQTPVGPSFDESARRDAATFESVPMHMSHVEVLVRDIAALEFFEEVRGGSNFATHVQCQLCDFMSKATVDQPSIVTELSRHLSSRMHSHRRQHGGGLPAIWGNLRAGPAPPPPPPPDLTRICWGFHKSVVNINGQLLATSTLHQYNAGNVDWFPEPYTYFEVKSKGREEAQVINGTFRSKDPPCQRFCVLSSGQRLPGLTCLSCADIGSRHSFRMALMRQHDVGRDQRFTNFAYLSHQELVKVAQDRTAEVVALQKSSWVLRQSFMRKTQQLRSIREDLEESALRGDTKRLIRNITKFAKEGKGEYRSALLPFVCDLMESAARRDAVTGHGSKGMRWRKTSKQLFAVIKLKGGESLIRFFRETAGAAADSTVAAQWNKDRVWIKMGEHRSNLVVIGKIYDALMKQHGIQGPVPWEFQEDETHMNGRLAWNPWWDIMVGTCGRKCDGHKCDANHAHEPIGSDVEGFHRVQDCALLDQRASYLRAVLITPLHPDLPALPVVVHPTCLRFDYSWVLKSWDLLDHFGEEVLASSLGPVAQGHGADGAAPLFKAMTLRMAIPPGPGRFHLAAPGLVITGKIVTINGKEFVKDLHSQDPRHNISKLYSVLDNRGKNFHLGKYTASHFDFTATAVLADKEDDKHGVIKRYLDRSDAQSKTGPSVLVARPMLGCMSKAVSGGYGRKEAFEGSLAYGRLLSRFVLIFFGTKQSGLDRARHAGYFLGLIRRARWHVKETNGLTLTANFLTAQTYAHSVQAAQVAILKLKAQRVYHEHLPEHIEDTGSNSVEKLWSSTGGYGAVASNQRDYDASEGLRRIEDLITLEKFAAQQEGMNFGGENRSTQRDLKIQGHENQDATDADPMVHFDDPELIEAWNEGDDEAKVEAEKLGMKPAGASEWWEQPWKEEESHIAEMKEDCDRSGAHLASNDRRRGIWR